MEEKETLHFKIGLSGSSARKQPEFRISVNGNKQVHLSAKLEELLNVELNPDNL